MTALKHFFREIATKWQRTVGKATSGERGATVTVICAMSERRKTLDVCLRLFELQQRKIGLRNAIKATHDSGDSSSEDE